VALAGIWLAAAESIVSVQSIHKPLDRFSNANSNTVARSGNVLVCAHHTQPYSNVSGAISVGAVDMKS